MSGKDSQKSGQDRRVVKAALILPFTGFFRSPADEIGRLLRRQSSRPCAARTRVRAATQTTKRRRCCGRDRVVEIQQPTGKREDGTTSGARTMTSLAPFARTRTSSTLWARTRTQLALWARTMVISKVGHRMSPPLSNCEGLSLWQKKNSTTQSHTQPSSLAPTFW